MKQYHPESKTFDDLVLDETGSLKTHGQGWVRVGSQEQINAVSAAITSGGEAWLDHSGSLKTSPPRPSAAHEWDADKKTWVLDKVAAQARKAAQQQEMWARIKQKRHDNLRGGVYVKSIGKWLHSDDESRAQYTFMRTMPALPEKMVWKTMDNTFVPMTKALLDELSLQLLADEQADFGNAERHRAAMLKAGNPMDYDYSGGWTANYATAEAQEGAK